MAVPLSALIAEHLAGTELFGGLGPAALADVARLGQVRSLTKNTTLFPQGAPADRCHALICGRVRIAQSGAEGGQILMRFVGPGETFGTVALFTDRHYPAEATTVIDSVEISWTEPVLLDLIHRHTQIAVNLVKIVGARLRETQERLRELATQPVDQRIAHALLRLAHTAGAEDASIEFPLTRQDVAAMCGATVYTVSRILSAWEKAGYLTTRHRHVSIQKLSAIRRLAGEISI
jgi:CRP/FNR family transcriptional regulator, nitrogen oxide reductase regulator